MAHCHDVLGIGFGPANIALAIALEESRQQEESGPLDVHFLEGQQDPLWQGGMLLEGSDIQNNPNRDLVTLRNPRSRYTFLNYLFEAGRIIEHLNLPGRFPLRAEYADYIKWARRHFDHQVDYGQRAESIEVTTHAGSPAYAVTTSTGAVHLGRCLVVAPGRTPYVPPPFDRVDDKRVFHFTEYLYRLDALPEPPASVVVIGGSQSAVEITLDLARRYPNAQVRNYVRAFGLRLKDTSPFSEEGFFPDFTKYYFGAPRESKRILDAFMRPTNYSSADEDVLHELYQVIYEQRLADRQRVWVNGNRLVKAVDQSDGGIHLTVAEVHTGAVEHVDADVVVLATGFRDLGPALNQEPYPGVLSGLADRLVFDDGYLRVSHDYLVETRDAPPLFLNGVCETSHGIGDAGSFSLLSLRTAAIQRRLADIIGGARGGGPVTINATTERHDFASTAPDGRPPVADVA
jgi:L-ornithine N5-monooxygenase